MATEEGKKRNLLTERIRRIIDRDFLVFVFFLLLSFSFWLLNGLGDELSSKIKYPVRFINPPDNRVLIGSLPSKLEFSVKGPGYTILKLKMSGSRAPVVVDMSTLNYLTNQGSRTYNYYVLTTGLKEDFSQQLRANIDIQRIQPDTLTFSFDLIESKKVPVIPIAEVLTDPEYFVNGKLSTEPDSITITGPRLIIDTVKFVMTKNLRYSGIKQSFTRNVSLVGSKQFLISDKKVKLIVPVDQFTEARLELPVKIINKPDSIEIRLFPNSVIVHLLVSVSDYKSVFESNISAIVDFASIDPEKSDKLPVIITSVPANTNTVKYTPQELDYIVEKRIK